MDFVDIIIEYLPIFMFLTMGVLLFIGYPVGFILGGVAITYGFIGYLFGVFKIAEFFNFVPRMWGFSAENLILVAIPSFVFMGTMMERSGIANDLLRTTQILLRKVPGGLAMSVTVMGTVLAAMTGIIGASVTMMTALALPTMLMAGTIIGTIFKADLSKNRVDVETNNLLCTIEWLNPVHDGPVSTMLKSPFMEHLLLTMGGYSFAIWNEGIMVSTRCPKF